MEAIRKRAGEGVRALAEWAAGTTLSAIPDVAIERAVRVLADDLAAIVGARAEPEVACFHDKMLGRASSAQATVFRGGRPRTDRISAAVANAVAADWLELDEGYRLTPCHAGLYTCPALLAQAEADDLAFGEMMRALVLGYEVVTRIARAWTPKAYVMQSHGRYGAVGAAAATALATGADAGRLHSALTGAATLIIASPRDHLVSGALVRNVWPAVAAWSGMMSVEWAQCGIGGVEGGFYDVYSTVHGGEAHPERLTEGLGTSWAILDGYTKIFACCQHLHSAVEAALGLRDELVERGGVERIATIEVETHALAVPLANARPTTTLGAKFSMPHALAATLVTGTGGADAFMSATLDDARITALREKVRVAPYAPVPAPPNDRPARVTVRLADGAEVVGECLSAQGGPDRPFPPAVLLDKVDALTRKVYPKLSPVLRALMEPQRARAAGGWAGIVGKICEETLARREA